jgi:hypothetical protein
MNSAVPVGRNLMMQLLLLLSLELSVARADPLCTNLPASTLEISMIKAEKVEERIVANERFEAMASFESDAVEGKPNQLTSRSSLMISMIGLIASFDITHQMLSRHDGTVCDSPVAVHLSFGTIQRTIIMPREVAADRCLKRLALRYESDRVEAAQKVVIRFVDDQTEDYQTVMHQLKMVPAANADLAIRRWNMVLGNMVDTARRQLTDDIRSAVARIDNVAPRARSSDECTNGDQWGGAGATMGRATTR